MDSGDGPNPDVAFVSVFGSSGPSELLFQGVVTIHEDFTLESFDGARLPADAVIEVYPTSGVRDNSTILQRFEVHISCSQLLFCPSLLGAVQLVGFRNPDQGEVVCPPVASFEYILTLPPSVEIGSVDFTLNGMPYPAALTVPSDVIRQPTNITVTVGANPSVTATYRAQLSIATRPSTDEVRCEESMLGEDDAFVSVFEDEIVYEDVFACPTEPGS